MPKGGPKHTACRPGTEVMLKFNDGRIEHDVFVDRKGGTMFFQRLGRVSKDEIRQFLIKKYKVKR